MSDKIVSERNFIIITFKMNGETDEVAKILMEKYLKLLTKVNKFFSTIH